MELWLWVINGIMWLIAAILVGIAMIALGGAISGED